MKAFYSAALILLTCTPVFAQNAAPQPTEEHKQLAKTVGTHTGTMKMWMQPDAAPMEMPFKETSSVVMNGFWVESNFESGPYKGRGMSGYDPSKKKFIGTWTNNMGPHLAIMQGDYDKKSHSITMLFKDYDPATGKLIDHKSVAVDAPGKPRTMTMFKKGDDKWVKVFVLTYDAKDK